MTMVFLSPSAAALATGGHTAYLATVNRAGQPFVSPVWIDYDGEYLLLNTATGTLKEKQMRNEPRVAMTITHRENPYDKVDIQGLVRGFVSGPRVHAHIDLLTQRYLGLKKYPWGAPGEQRLITQIEPIRVNEVSYHPATGSISRGQHTQSPGQ